MKYRIFTDLPAILILLNFLVFPVSKAWSQEAGTIVPDLKNGQTQTDVLHLTAKINNMSDELYLHFNPAATDGFDCLYDAYKLTSFAGNAVPDIYTVDSTGTKYSINTFPFTGTEKSVDMAFEVGTSGNVTLIATGLETFKSHPELGIFLLDTKTDYEISLQSNSEYIFSYLTTDDPNRFKIRFAVSLTGISNQRTKPTRCNVFAFNKDLSIQYKDLKGQKGQAEVYDMSGRNIRTVLLDGSGSQNVVMQSNTGIYLIKLIFSDYSETHKIAVR